MPLEKRPANPIPKGPRPGSRTPPHQVRDSETLETVAQKYGLSVSALLLHNFGTLDTMEINWYLRENVGCNLPTYDHANWRFSSAAKPGLIYIPQQVLQMDPLLITGQVDSPPVIEGIKERRESILNNTPAVFRIKPNPAISGDPNPWYAKQDLEETSSNWVTIQRVARMRGLDPDFVSAIVWMESTHGWYDRFDPKNKTIRPMNVHAELWHLDRIRLGDPEYNIVKGVDILKAIWDRTEDPDFEKVATLYNQLGAKEVNRYGKTVVSYMKTRPWSSAIGRSRQEHLQETTRPMKQWTNQ
jgi:hypothetical protein